MKDMGETSYVIGIEIFLDESQGFLDLSQKANINKVLERFIMKKCSTSLVPIRRGDKFSLMQYQSWYGMETDGRNSLCICC